MTSSTQRQILLIPIRIVFQITASGPKSQSEKWISQMSCQKFISLRSLLHTHSSTHSRVISRHFPNRVTHTPRKYITHASHRSSLVATSAYSETRLPTTSRLPRSKYGISPIILLPPDRCIPYRTPSGYSLKENCINKINISQMPLKRTFGVQDAINTQFTATACQPSIECQGRWSGTYHTIR